MYFLAKFRFDRAENEPAKNLQIFRKKLPSVDLEDVLPERRLADAEETGVVRGASLRRRGDSGCARAKLSARSVLSFARLKAPPCARSWVEFVDPDRFISR